MGESNNDFYLPEFEDSSNNKPSKINVSKNYGELQSLKTKNRILINQIMTLKFQDRHQN